MTDSEPIRPPEPVTMAMGVKRREISESLVEGGREPRRGREGPPARSVHYRRGFLAKVAVFRGASVSPPI
jgi:hypothetical protein